MPRFLLLPVGVILKISTFNFLQIVEEEWSFFFCMQHVVIYSLFFLEIENFTKQAQRRAAAGRSRHKSHGVIQY